jgi:hypothetical protein
VSVGDGISGLGPTRYRWVPEVHQVVRDVLRLEPAATANTYVCHPWCGWGKLSVDFWGPGGRGDPIRRDVALRSLDFVFNLPGKPFLRHYIFEHDLWTSFGGHSTWFKDDHYGDLRHLHLTYWPVDG